DNVYVVTVQVSDGSLTATQTLNVTVTNVNEPPTVTSNGGGATASVNVPENTTAVTAVGGYDPDVPTTLAYSILGGPHAGNFSVNAGTGALAFLSAPIFEAPTDADANNVYVVMVQVSDGTLTASQTLNVMVTNVVEPLIVTSDGGGATAG